MSVAETRSSKPPVGAMTRIGTVERGRPNEAWNRTRASMSIERRYPAAVSASSSSSYRAAIASTMSAAGVEAQRLLHANVTDDGISEQDTDERSVVDHRQEGNVPAAEAVDRRDELVVRRDRGQLRCRPHDGVHGCRWPFALLDFSEVRDRDEPDEPALRDDRDRLKVVRQNDVADQLPDRERGGRGPEVGRHELTHPNAADGRSHAVLSDRRARKAEQEIGEDEEPRAPGVALEEHGVRPDERQDARDDLSAARGDARR